MRNRWVSTTLNVAQRKDDVTILSSGVAEAVAALKAESGKEIWLFGGVRLLPEGRRWPLRLADYKTMPIREIVRLKYA